MGSKRDWCPKQYGRCDYVLERCFSTPWAAVENSADRQVFAMESEEEEETTKYGVLTCTRTNVDIHACLADYPNGAVDKHLEEVVVNGRPTRLYLQVTWCHDSEDEEDTAYEETQLYVKKFLNAVTDYLSTWHDDNRHHVCVMRCPSPKNSHSYRIVFPEVLFDRVLIEMRSFVYNCLGWMCKEYARQDWFEACTVQTDIYQPNTRLLAVGQSYAHRKDGRVSIEVDLCRGDAGKVRHSYVQPADVSAPRSDLLLLPTKRRRRHEPNQSIRSRRRVKTD
jgi:hypothetical protein